MDEQLKKHTLVQSVKRNHRFCINKYRPLQSDCIYIHSMPVNISGYNSALKKLAKGILDIMDLIRGEESGTFVDVFYVFNSNQDGELFLNMYFTKYILDLNMFSGRVRKKYLKE